MAFARWPWGDIAHRRLPLRRALRPPRCRPMLEVLERRTLLSGDPLGSATQLNFTPSPTTPAMQSASAAGYLANPQQVNLYLVHLHQGDQINATVAAQAIGSGLQSNLRVLDSAGRQVALDDQEGGDPRLTFQAAAAGNYYLGVGSAGGTTGLYTLDVRETTGAAPAADLAGASFRLGSQTAAWGDTVPVRFQVENRGGANAGPFAVQLVLADSNLLAASSAHDVLATFTVAGLGPGLHQSEHFSVTLPSAASAAAAGFSPSGPVYLDVVLGTGGDSGGVHRGENYETLTVVQRVNANGGNHTPAAAQALADANSRIAGTLEAGQTDWYQLTVTEAGRLTVSVAAPGDSDLPALNLADSGGQMLIQSDNGSIVQALQPGIYLLSVSTNSTVGRYALTTTFVQAGPPLAPFAVNPSAQAPAADFSGNSRALVTADLNRDGKADLVAADTLGNTVSVLLGNGDGTFQPARSYSLGTALSTLATAALQTNGQSVTVADLTGNGKLDLIVTNAFDNTVSVLRGNGDGTFQAAQTYTTGDFPYAVAAADVNRDHRPDLVVTNLLGNSVSVLLNNGDGTFRAATTVAVGEFPTSVAVAKLTRDGNPDLVVTNALDNTIEVLHGNGDGTFTAEQTYAVGQFPTAVTVANLNSDGNPDLVFTSILDNTVGVLLGNGDGTFQPLHNYTTGVLPDSVTVTHLRGPREPADLVVVNARDNTVGVLLGNGDGTFAPQHIYPAGISPTSVVAADVNGDGVLDLVAADAFDNTFSVLPGIGDGTFRPKQQTLPTGINPETVAVGDLTGNGRLDLVVANAGTNNVSVALANGDGTFQTPHTYTVGANPRSVAIADLRGNGIYDIIVANAGDGTVGVLLGNGDGTFRAEQTCTAGRFPSAVAVCDVNGDSIPDIVVANTGDQTVGVLLGNGNGTFQAQQTCAVGSTPSAVVVADVSGDGFPDIVVANAGEGTVGVLLGDGDGKFQAEQTFKVGRDPTGVAVADLNGDGRADVVAVNNQDGTISVLLGSGGGQFQGQQIDAVGPDATMVSVGDVNGDGKPDLAVSNALGTTVSVLLNKGDGTFQTQRTVTVDPFPTSVVIADVNGDGRPDLLSANAFNDTVSVLRGNGDGTFPSQQAGLATGPNPRRMATADLNGDGKPDLVVDNAFGNSIGVLLGNGDGTFQAQKTFATGILPRAVTVADLNGDGKQDLVVANSANYTVGVLLGNGDGTFQSQQTYAVGVFPSAVTVGDVNGDGIPDIAVANSLGNTVGVLLGKGGGTFRPQQTYQVGDLPSSVVLADFRHDGKPDLVVTNLFGYTISVLHNNDNGTFGPQKTYAVGPFPTAVVAAALTPGGPLDLVVANGSGAAGGSVSVLRDNGDGTFQAQQTYAVGDVPTSVAVRDLNGDGKPDVIVANLESDSISVLPGNGDGTLRPQQTLPAGGYPAALALADFNNDGIPDLAVAHLEANTVGVLLGDGRGGFTSTGANTVSTPNTPHVIPLPGPGGLPEYVILDRSGNILVRRGLDGAPAIINDRAAIGEDLPARDITVLPYEGGWAIAAIDALPESPTNLVYSVSLYAVAADGTISAPQTVFTTSVLPTGITAGDLTGAGRYDLVLTNSLHNSLQVLFQQSDGSFGSPLTLAVGEAPSDVSLADVNGDHLLDIEVANQGSGDVSVFLNDTNHAFAQGYRFRAGAGLDGLDTSAGTPVVRSLLEPVSLAAGDFTGAGRNDLVVIDRGSDSFAVLANKGGDSFAAPREFRTTSPADGPDVIAQPGPVVAGYFHGAGRPEDLAVLMENLDQVWIYTGNGKGAFTHTQSIAAGYSPTGLAVAADPETGFDDLLVGDPFGDVLALQGRGDGTFEALPSVTGDRVPLAAQATGGVGGPAVLVANQQTGRITVQVQAPGGTQFVPVETLVGPTPPALLAPGAVQWVRLDRNNPFLDAVVVASGANEVLVYTGTGPGTVNPLPRTFAVGTDPVSVTIADVNGDGILDLLAADQGSNDVATLFGSYGNDGGWLGTAGPRLHSGGSGPVAVKFLPPATPGDNPQLLVTNGQSGTLAVLPGVGQGFFNDQPDAIKVISVPGNPHLESPTFLTSGLGVLPTADGRLFTFNPNDPGASIEESFAAPSGVGVAAVAAAPGGGLVAALQDGQVLEMALDPSTESFAVTGSLAALNGIPAQPSALDVLESESGLEVLVTSAGSDQVFVFGTEEALQQAASEGLPAPVAGSPLASVGVAPGAEGGDDLGTFTFALPVEVLLPGNLATGESAATLSAEGSNGVNVTVFNLLVNTLLKPADPAGEGEEVGEAPPEKESKIGPDAEEGLRKIDLEEKAQPAEPMGPASRLDLPPDAGNPAPLAPTDPSSKEKVGAAPAQQPPAAEPSDSTALEDRVWIDWSLGDRAVEAAPEAPPSGARPGPQGSFASLDSRIEDAVAGRAAQGEAAPAWCSAAFLGALAGGLLPWGDGDRESIRLAMSRQQWVKLKNPK